MPHRAHRVPQVSSILIREDRDVHVAELDLLHLARVGLLAVLFLQVCMLGAYFDIRPH